MKPTAPVQTSLAAGSVAAMSSALAASTPGLLECYELRAYHLRRGPIVTGFDIAFSAEVALPAWTRAKEQAPSEFSM